MSLQRRTVGLQKGDSAKRNTSVKVKTTKRKSDSTCGISSKDISFPNAKIQKRTQKSDLKVCLKSFLSVNNETEYLQNCFC